MVSDKGIMCKSGVTCEHMDSCFSEPSENLTTNDFVTYNTLRLAGCIYLSYPFDKLQMLKEQDFFYSHISLLEFMFSWYIFP
jgi:hypothetical protein